MLTNKLNRNKQSGFTIIEVMIVLAIAGLIMAIVFLAVPALQRNNRNTQRTADASRVLAAVGECMANKNGQINSCNTGALLDPTYIQVSNNQQLITMAVGAGNGTVNSINLTFGVVCTAAGDATTATGASARSYVAMFQLEGRTGAIQRCISS